VHFACSLISCSFSGDANQTLILLPWLGERAPGCLKQTGCG